MKKTLLGSIADIQTGPFGSQLHKEDYVENGTPIVTVEHLGNRVFTEQNLPMVSDYDKERLNKYVLCEGDIVFSRVGSVDRCSYVDSNHSGWMFSGRCLRVRPSDKLYPLYLYYYFCMESTKRFVRNIAVGATMPSINTKLMGEVEVSVPSIDTQKRIATILSSIDDKIELNAVINENLEQQAQAIFKSWFVDFKPFGGVMPEDWNVCTLDSICNLIIKGITPKYTEDSEQLVINQKCVRNHQIDLSLARPHIPKKTNEKWLKYGDILVNSTGTGTLGRAAQVLFVPNNLTVDSHVTIIRASKAEYIHFLGLWATSHEHDFVMLQTGSTGQTDLPRERLKKMQILLPSIDILKKFSSIIKPISDTQINNHQENQRLSALRDTLLPKLMNGEIDVSQVRI